MNRRTFLDPNRGGSPALRAARALRRRRRTEVSIRGQQFFINGKPTYAGRSYKGMKIEGLLMNVRAVQATFDDLNPETRSKWAYPDTGKWDPERNVREFVAALPEWKRYGAAGVHGESAGRQSRGLFEGAAVGEHGDRPERRSAAGVHGPDGARDRARRRIGHGRDRRILLFRAGSAGEGRSRGAARGEQRHQLAAGPRLSQRAGGDRQRDQCRRVRSRRSSSRTGCTN